MTERQRFGRGGPAQPADSNSQDENGGQRFGSRGSVDSSSSSSSVPLPRGDDRGDKPQFGGSASVNRGNPPFGGRQHESQETHGVHGRDRDQKSNDGHNPFANNRDQGSNDVGNGRAPFGNQNPAASRPVFGSGRGGERNSHDARSTSFGNGGERGDGRPSARFSSRSFENTAGRSDENFGRMRSDEEQHRPAAARGNTSFGGRDAVDSRHSDRGGFARDGRDSRDDTRSVGFGIGDQHQAARQPLTSSTNLPQSRPVPDDNQQKASEAQEKCKNAAAQINKVLFETRDFSDVILVPEDGMEVHAHKVILAARSPLFREIFFGPAKQATAAEKAKQESEEEVEANVTAEVETREQQMGKSDSGEADEEQGEAGTESEKGEASETEEGETKEEEGKKTVETEEKSVQEANQVKAVPKKMKKKPAEAALKEEAVKAESEVNHDDETVLEKPKKDQVKAVPADATAQTDHHAEVSRLEMGGMFSKKVVEIFLEFVYKGEAVNCSHDEMHLVFLLASKYKVEDVRDLAALELTKNITGDTFVKLLITATDEGSVVMKQKVMDFIVKERKSVLQRDDFKNLRIGNSPLYLDILESLALH
ncbi:hypothetical protein RvY_12203 [Ramazzottius varieornatus]|uniref:BTB domain-containing protein n=1 Tax=Ramazzottius varieornatus TaxID=947166 RepID=A0A1D1VSH1_RAMVA|nr:hypothetical protein RvY_12203 [Ramazzottius varieornatus]